VIEQVKYEGYSGHGCSHSVNMQMTEKETKTPGDQLLTQAIR